MTRLFRFQYAGGQAAVNPRNVLAICTGVRGSLVMVDGQDGKMTFPECVGTVDELADRLEACLADKPPARVRRPAKLVDQVRPAMAEARARGWSQDEINKVILRLCPQGIHYMTDDEFAELRRVIGGEP